MPSPAPGVGQSFQTWAELENTYQYVQTYKPALFDQRLDEVQREIKELRRQVELGAKINDTLGRPPVTTGDNGKILPINSPAHPGGARSGGSAAARTRRIFRDHADVADRMEAGEFRSVRAAALEAGIAGLTSTLTTPRYNEL